MAEFEEGQEGEEKERANVIFAQVVANPPRDRMMEVTNLPLDKLRPLTWMKTFNAEAFLLFDDIYTAQEKYNEIFVNNKKEALSYYKDYFTELLEKAENGEYVITNKVKVNRSFIDKLSGKKGYNVVILSQEETGKRIQKELDKIEEQDSKVYPAVKWFDDWENGQKLLTLLADEWIYTYCQTRRSLGGEFMRHAVVLTQDQIAASQDADKNPLDTLPQ